MGRPRLVLLLNILLCCAVDISAGRDFYKILEVSRGADDKSIKKAYRSLALKWHPDKNADNTEEAQAKFTEISNAYEVLSDPEKRKVYDQFGEEGLQGGGPGGPGGGGAGFHANFGDPFSMFKDLFGADGGDVKEEVVCPAGLERSSVEEGSQMVEDFREEADFPVVEEGSQVVEDFREEADFQEEADFLEEADSLDTKKSYIPRIARPQAKLQPSRRLAEAVKGALKVAYVDCEEHELLCSQHEVEAVPTFKVFVDGDSETFTGSPDIKKLKEWLVSKIPYTSDVLAPLPDVALAHEWLAHACGPKVPPEWPARSPGGE
eukprot:gene22728-27438_t